MEITLPIMENHGIVFSNFCENHVLRKQRLMRLFNLFSQAWAKMFEVPIRSKSGLRTTGLFVSIYQCVCIFFVKAMFSTGIDHNHFKLNDYNFNKQGYA